MFRVMATISSLALLVSCGRGEDYQTLRSPLSDRDNDSVAEVANSDESGDTETQSAEEVFANCAGLSLDDVVSGPELTLAEAKSFCNATKDFTATQPTPDRDS